MNKYVGVWPLELNPVDYAVILNGMKLDGFVSDSIITITDTWVIDIELYENHMFYDVLLNLYEANEYFLFHIQSVNYLDSFFADRVLINRVKSEKGIVKCTFFCRELKRQIKSDGPLMSFEKALQRPKPLGGFWSCSKCDNPFFGTGKCFSCNKYHMPI